MKDPSGSYQLAIHPEHLNIFYQSDIPRRSNAGNFMYDAETDSVIRVSSREKVNNCHAGKISETAARKIKRAVDYLVYLVPRKKYFTTADGRAGNYFLSFVTLTLSSQQIHSDNEIKRSILEPLLNEMRKKWKVSNYIWRAEKQQNGNLHFHIVADRFIWWSDLRDSWNYYQERLGYVTRYREHQKAFHSAGFKYRPELEAKWNKAAQYKAYKAGIHCDWNSPNSTDIHSLKTITSVRSYICKYITKSEQSQDVSGRLWGCSYELTDLRGSREFAEGSLHDDVDKLLSCPDVKIYKSDYFTVIYFNRRILESLNCNQILESFDSYLYDHFPEYRDRDLFPIAA